MRPFMTLLANLVLLCSGSCFADEPSQNRAVSEAQTQPKQEAQIDFDRARELLQKRSRGQQLDQDEQAYLQRAMEARRQQRGGQAAGRRDERVLRPNERSGLIPLDEMTAEASYLGEDGGLYGRGSNQPPAALRDHAKRELKEIGPLDSNGRASADGKVVLVSISMSNATQEFSRFKQIADADSDKSSDLTIVDCAQGGQAMAEWVDPEAGPWNEAMRRIERAGVSPLQVQVAWVKLANKAPRGDLATHGGKLLRDTAAVIQNAKKKFPNLRVVYLSSRIYGGYSGGALNPEPYAYESGFVVRRLIQQQAGAAAWTDEVNAGTSNESGVGKTQSSPVLLWGPYLWADGITPRQSDGLVWKREDLVGDGTHPSNSGRDKVARMLLTFFKEDPLARSWFLGTYRASPQE